MQNFPAEYTLQRLMIGDVVCGENCYDRLELNVKRVAHTHMLGKKQFNYVII